VVRAWELVSVVAILAVTTLAVQLLRTNRVIRADAGRRVRRPITWLVGVPLFALVVGVGIPYVDAHVFNGPTPPPLSFADLEPAPAGAAAGSPPVRAATSAAITPGGTTTTVVRGVVGPSPTGSAVPAAAIGSDVPATPPPAGQPPAGQVVAALPEDPVAGSWTVGSGSQARYGIDDTAMGQTSHVVGQTHEVSGTARIVGYTVTSADVVVNMQSVTCGCVHDVKYQQMLDTSMYPTSTFVLTSPISLASIPAPGAVITVPVTGNFTIHGVTRSVTFSLEATRIGPRIAVMATIPVNLADYNIQSPNAGSLGGLSNCTMDFLIAFDPTS